MGSHAGPPVMAGSIRRAAVACAEELIGGRIIAARCYRPRYLNIQRLNYLWTVRHSSAWIQAT
jgi:hypothetical protein